LVLSWQAPAGCPDLASQRADIRRRVGEARPTAEPVVASGEIRRDSSGGFVLSLRTSAGTTSGERVLSGPDCHQLAEAAALILAMLIKPEAQAEPPAPAPAPPPAPAPSPPVGPRFGVGADALLATGVLPHLAEGLALRFVYARGMLAAAAQVAGLLPQTVEVAAWPGATASFYRLDSAVQFCATTARERRVFGALCLGGSLVRLHGRSAGIARTGQATGVWVEASVEPSLSVRLTTALRLRLALDGRDLGSRPDMAVAGLGHVYQPAAFSLRGALGIDYWF
jgi:hypothetical protein